ncbi:MAG TPA: sugar phosphate nucleotidyltransferase [Candidatus Eisenbacteria bacterium]|nr:sugar phosphate nucleotidyltransferase [Candidatus Eisenbacteria bacterium]
MASRRWVVVLAAGSGTRVRDMTLDASGATIPKQYWSGRNGVPMLRLALRRARMLTTATRVVAVVAAEHRAYWEPHLRSFPSSNVVVQPFDRGTAVGVLLPLLRVLRRDPHSTVALLPADHAVENEDVVLERLQTAFTLAQGGRQALLLGATPDSADPEYGWVECGPVAVDGTRPILAFEEKPGFSRARRLQRRGAYWSTFMLVASGRALLAMYERAAPQLFRALAPVSQQPGERLTSIYAKLPVADFSRDVLEPVAPWVRLLPMPRCGWTDLGTPARLARWMEQGKPERSTRRQLPTRREPATRREPELSETPA